MNINNFFALIRVKVSANLRTEVSRYYLNYLWWVIEPILTMMVFYIIFGIMLNRGRINFIGFLLIGIASWNWFSRSVMNGSNSIYNARGLILQVKIPKIFFPIVVVSQDTFKHLFVTALILIFLYFYPTPVTICWIALPVLMAIQFVLILATATLCAALVPFLQDLKFIIQTGLHLMFFASGIFYSLEDVVLPHHRQIVYLNPMAGLIKNYRCILIEGLWPDWWYLIAVFMFALVLLLFSVWLVFRLDYIYPRVCQQ